MIKGCFMCKYNYVFCSCTIYLTVYIVQLNISYRQILYIAICLHTDMNLRNIPLLIHTV